MRPSRVRSSGPAASSHRFSSVDCITTTSESEFSVHTTLWHFDAAEWAPSTASIALGTIGPFGLHYATRSRIRAYEERPESSSAVGRNVCPGGQKRPRQEKSDDADRANKGGPKGGGASRAALASSDRSRMATERRVRPPLGWLTCPRPWAGVAVAVGLWAASARMRSYLPTATRPAPYGTG
jgi:hypothetical protein